MIIAVIAAAGSGTRLGTGIPKALAPLAGHPLISYSVRTFSALECIDEIIVVAPPNHHHTFSELVAQHLRTRVIVGGRDRSDSIYAGISEYQQHENIFFLIHDAARALVSTIVIQRVIDALNDGALAAIPVLPVVDTIKTIDDSGRVDHTVPRKNLVITQTPQGFRGDILWQAYQQKDIHEHTDDAGLVEALGVPIMVVPGDSYGLKITTPQDLGIAEHLLLQQ